MSHEVVVVPPEKRRIWPWTLSWQEADPRRYPFDAARALTVVRGLAPAAEVPARPPGTPAELSAMGWGHGPAARWADAMSTALVDHYGRWACGWRWSIGEGDFGGGPVGSWCCPRDSITTRDETLAAVAESLVEWRAWLEDLAERFSRFLPVPPGAPDDVLLDTWERAVAHLVTVVVDRTFAESGWQGLCMRVLTWFLTEAGVPGERHRRLIGDAIGGRFLSWVTPSPLTITEVAERFAADVMRPPDA